MVIQDLVVAVSKNLIKVYCNREHWIVCDCCDSLTEVVTEYYRLAEPDGSGLTRRYLDCCKHKVGTVIDWEEEKETNGKTPFGSRV